MQTSFKGGGWGLPGGANGSLTTGPRDHQVSDRFAVTFPSKTQFCFASTHTGVTSVAPTRIERGRSLRYILPPAYTEPPAQGPCPSLTPFFSSPVSSSLLSPRTPAWPLKWAIISTSVCVSSMSDAVLWGQRPQVWCYSWLAHGGCSLGK